MSIEMIKKASLGAFGAACLVAGSSAMAQVPSNTPGQWDAIVLNGSTVVSSATKTFSGTTVLTTSGLEAECELSLTGQVTLDTTNDIVDITISDGDVAAGDFTCNFIGLAFPWNAYEDETDAAAGNSNTGLSGAVSPATLTSDVNGYVGNIDVTFPGCEGYIEVTYNNNGSSASTFDFNGPIVGTGGCTVDGTLSAQGGDINVY